MALANLYGICLTGGVRRLGCPFHSYVKATYKEKWIDQETEILKKQKN